MKNVAPVRRELGVKTFFNMLGPLVNPAFPKNQLTGVFNLELARLYHYLFQKTDTNFTILYALDGYDEISLTGPTKAFSKNSEGILTPQDFGVLPLEASQIAGGDNVVISMFFGSSNLTKSCCRSIPPGRFRICEEITEFSCAFFLHAVEAKG